MGWKEELPDQGPAPDYGRGDLRHENRGVTEQSIKEMIADRLSAESGSFVSSGNIEVVTAPLHRFPWEVRILPEEFMDTSTNPPTKISQATIRIFKGLVRYSILNTLGYETKHSHIRYVNGKQQVPIKIQGNRLSSPGDLDWIPSTNQRDPNAIIPEGPGQQVAWPPTFVGGGGAGASSASSRDPEPKDGGVPFETGGDNIGLNGWNATGADGMPWFDVPYSADKPIWLAGRIGDDGNFEFSVFVGNVPDQPPARRLFKMLIAHVTSMDLVHQYLRSDVIIFQFLPPNPVGAANTTGYHLVKSSHDQLHVEWQEWEAPDDGEMYARKNKAWVAFEPGEGGGGGGDPVYATHPFRVRLVDGIYSINAGTLNNVEVISALAQPASIPSYVYLKVDFASTAPHAITNRSIVVDTDGDLHLLSDDLTSYMKIAAIQTYGIQQYVTGSLWLDRIKVGNLAARYYYARI